MPEPKKPAVTRLAVYAYVLAAVVVLLDQWSKWWVLNGLQLEERGPVQVLPFFRLTLVWNRGVSFNLMRADHEIGRWLLVAAALAVVAWLVNWVRSADRPWLATALGLIIGGAIGNNLIDRVRLGHVTDFLDFSALWFPWVFNVADSAISVGVVLLLWDVFVAPKAAPENAADKPA